MFHPSDYETVSEDDSEFPALTKPNIPKTFIEAIPTHELTQFSYLAKNPLDMSQHLIEEKVKLAVTPPYGPFPLQIVHSLPCRNWVHHTITDLISTESLLLINKLSYA